MSSIESSVNKAVTECNAYVDKVRVAKEKEMGKQARMESHRLRVERNRQKALASALNLRVESRAAEIGAV